MKNGGGRYIHSLNRFSESPPSGQCRGHHCERVDFTLSEDVKGSMP